MRSRGTRESVLAQMKLGAESCHEGSAHLFIKSFFSFLLRREGLIQAMTNEKCGSVPPLF